MDLKAYDFLYDIGNMEGGWQDVAWERKRKQDWQDLIILEHEKGACRGVEGGDERKCLSLEGHRERFHRYDIHTSSFPT